MHKHTFFVLICLICLCYINPSPKQQQKHLDCGGGSDDRSQDTSATSRVHRMFFPARGTALSLINVETVHSIRINMPGVILDCCRVSRALFALRLCILVRLECGFRYETNFDCVL